jgi:hypothetical protein
VIKPLCPSIIDDSKLQVIWIHPFDAILSYPHANLQWRREMLMDDAKKLQELSQQNGIQVHLGVSAAPHTYKLQYNNIKLIFELKKVNPDNFTIFYTRDTNGAPSNSGMLESSPQYYDIPHAGPLFARTDTLMIKGNFRNRCHLDAVLQSATYIKQILISTGDVPIYPLDIKKGKLHTQIDDEPGIDLTDEFRCYRQHNMKIFFRDEVLDKIGQIKLI